MTTLTAIETQYNGYRFRSRLEARWAVFFDTLGIAYQYEMEGYSLGSSRRRYLPDFYLPKQDVWIEIKGEEPTPEETDLATLLAEASEKDVYIFFGEIGWDREWTTGNDSAHKLYAGGQGWDNHHIWCECSVCGKLGIRFSGEADRLGCGCNTKSPNPDSPRLMKAYDAARSARFDGR